MANVKISGFSALSQTSSAPTTDVVPVVSGGSNYKQTTQDFVSVGLRNVKGTTATDLPVYGAELLTSAGWTVNAGWTESPDDVFTHTSGGGTGTLTHSATIANGTKYQISWTITGRTAGSVTISVGGQSVGSQTATGSFGPTATSTAAFTITPTNDFDGVVSLVSLKAITAVSTAAVQIFDSAGVPQIEIRDGTAAGTTFVGYQAGGYNTTGAGNTAAGYQALYSNTTGTYNTAAGYRALYSNTTGAGNTAAGYQALYSNTTGTYNTAAGYQALYSNTTGAYNTAAGHQALYFNTTGTYNTAAGYQALYSNTTGTYNTAAGYQALYSNTTGAGNTAAGLQALYVNTTGANNTAAGHRAGYTSTPGNANVTGSNNTWVGYNSGPGTSTQLDNSFAYGYGALVSASNQGVLGNASVTNVTCMSNGNAALGSGIIGWKQLYIDYTNTATVGAVTINKAAGRVNIAAGGVSVTVTNSLVTAASHVFAVCSTNDTTAYVKNVVPAAGSFTITLGAAATAQTSIDFFVVSAD